MLWCRMNTAIKNEILPSSGMDDEEFRQWQALTPEEQLLRMRRAIQNGFESGLSHETMDEIWARLRARHPDARP